MALHVTCWPRVTGPIVLDAIRSAMAAHMAEWQNRPLDPVYPVIFIACSALDGSEGFGAGAVAAACHVHALQTISAVHEISMTLKNT